MEENADICVVTYNKEGEEKCTVVQQDRNSVADYELLTCVCFVFEGAMQYVWLFIASIYY